MIGVIPGLGPFLEVSRVSLPVATPGPTVSFLSFSNRGASMWDTLFPFGPMAQVQHLPLAYDSGCETVCVSEFSLVRASGCPPQPGAFLRLGRLFYRLE